MLVFRTEDNSDKSYNDDRGIDLDAVGRSFKSSNCKTSILTVSDVRYLPCLHG